MRGKNLRLFTSTFLLPSLLACLIGTVHAPLLGRAWASQPLAVLRTSGRLVNLEGKGIAAIPVYLWEQKGELSLATKTARDGSFNFEHPPCNRLTLEILPPLKTSYASALMDDVPGDENRKLIVEMHLGHLISGRITHDGKGLKGLLVRVSPAEIDKHGSQIDYSSLERAERIHGSGTTTTGKDGGFTLILTAGHKQLTVINNKYPRLEKTVEHSLTVRENQNIGALRL